MSKSTQNYKMRHVEKEIILSELKVNPENPRYRNSYLTEEEAINALLKEVKKNPKESMKYMLNLIDDIANHGINPTELPIVIPDEEDTGKYKVLEGNRRIAALKILYNAGLAEKLFPSEEKRKQLEDSRKLFFEKFGDQFKSIKCIVFSNEEEAEHWIALRHTGENEGRGLTPWDKEAKDRFRQSKQQEHKDNKDLLGIRIKDLLIQNKLLKPNEDITLTTVERVVKDPYVQSSLKIGISGGEIRLPKEASDREIALKALQRIALDTTRSLGGKKRLTSRNANTKAQRKNYIDNLIHELKYSTHLQIEKKDTKTEPHTDSSDYKYRSFVAKPGLKIGHPRLRHIYDELCKLKAKAYPNVAAASIRVFFEGSLDIFLEHCKLRCSDHCGNALEGHDIKRIPWLALSKKLELAVTCLESKLDHFGKIAQAVRKYQSQKHNPLHTDTLQAYLHNTEFEPNEESIKYWWDAYHSFFEALWNLYNETATGTN